jgi:hypothetical protein
MEADAAKDSEEKHENTVPVQKPVGTPLRDIEWVVVPGKAVDDWHAYLMTRPFGEVAELMGYFRQVNLAKVTKVDKTQPEGNGASTEAQ